MTDVACTMKTHALWAQPQMQLAAHVMLTLGTTLWHVCSPLLPTSYTILTEATIFATIIKSFN